MSQRRMEPAYGVPNDGRGTRRPALPPRWVFIPLADERTASVFLVRTVCYDAVNRFIEIEIEREKPISERKFVHNVKHLKFDGQNRSADKNNREE